jgi:hypothetical protein
MPLGCGGDQTLLKASCRNCEAITSRHEDIVQHKVLHVMRAIAGYPRNKGKKPIQEAEFEVKRNGEKSREFLRIKDVPFAAAAPDLPLPQVLNPYAKTVTPDDLTYQCVYRRNKPFGDYDEIAFPGEFPLESFYRTLAKIGHCCGVWEYGIDGFESFMPPFILGGRKDYGLYVGISPGVLDWDLSEHCIGHRNFIWHGQTLLSVGIRFFARAMFPTYEVVIGRPKPR